MRIQAALSRRSTCWLSWMFLLVGTGTVGQAQEERYELGKRLRRFELAWQDADTAGRVSCVAPMQKAVQSFFSLRLSVAARELDQAYFAVERIEAPSDFKRFAISRRFTFGPSVIDESHSSLDLKLAAFYKVDEPPPADAKVRIEIHAADETVLMTEDFTVKALADGCKVDVSQLAEGDFRLTATSTSGSQSIPFADATLSRIRDVNSRLQRLEERLRTRGSGEPTVIQSTNQLTCKQLLRTIRSQLDGQVQEVDYPALRLMKTCEALLIDEVDSVLFFQQQATEKIGRASCRERVCT